MENTLNNSKKIIDLAFQQLINVQEALERKQGFKQRSPNFIQDQIMNYDQEIGQLISFIEKSIQKNFINLFLILKKHFKSPINKLTVCNQVYEINLPTQKNIAHDYCKSIRSIFDVNHCQRKGSVNTNLFQKSNNLHNNNEFGEKFQSETNMSAKTENQNKLIQSDPQSNVFYSEKVQQKQNLVNFVSPRTEINTPQRKNNFFNLKNQENLTNQDAINQSNQNQFQEEIHKSNIENKNAKVSYSGSFSDRAAHGEMNQIYQIFKNKLPLQINISELSESRNLNHKEEFPVFQSPNFNNNLTRENINKAFNTNNQSQSQVTTLSRQTQNIRDISASYLQNIDIDHSNSIKTRDIDPIINGSENEGLNDNFYQEIQNDSFSEQFYNKKLEDLF